MSRYIAVATFLLGLLVVQGVHAKDVDMTITPRAVGVLARPGTVVRIPLTVTNSAASQYLKPIALTARDVDGESQTEYSPVDSLPIRASFFEGEERIDQALLFSKGRAKKLTYQFELSDRIATGDYLLVAGVETQVDHLPTTYSVRSKVRLVAPVLLTVSHTGSVDIKGVIRAFGINSGQYFFDSFDPIPFQLSVANTGRNAIRAGGVVVVRNAFGQSATYDLEDKLILSNTSRSLSLGNSYSDGNKIQGFFVGKYTVTASVNVTDGAVQLTRSTSFYAFPFKILFGGIVVTIGGLIMLRKRR